METKSENLVKEILEIDVNLIEASDTDLRAEIFRGLKKSRKKIDSKFFYDKKGSQLFEEITRLKEYYPSRTERNILEQYAKEIMQSFSGTQLIELASGDCSKISILLDACYLVQREHMTYIPVDVSESAIYHSAKALSDRFPEIEIKALVSDFMSQDLELSSDVNKMICFLGSTIGNLKPKDAKHLLAKIAALMQKGDCFLLGLDMVKDKDILHAAYNDDKAVTSAFNINILNHVNSICRTNLQEKDFKHVAFYNEEESRIEMHLKAKRAMKINSPFWPESIYFDAGETIHTENSHKYTRESISELIASTGLEIDQFYTDEQEWFSLVLLKKIE